MKKTSNEYFGGFLKMAPLSHALWRTVEAKSFGSVSLKTPILDLGCGFGEFAGVVFGKIQCGVDIRKKDLDAAFTSGQYEKTILADARSLPFPDSCFATIVSVSVLEHISGTDKVLKEAARVLVKGGRIVFSAPTPALYDSLFYPKILESLHLGYFSKLYKFAHKKIFGHLSLYGKNEWKKLLEQNGFRVLRIEGTISKELARTHDKFLVTAFPSQLFRWILGRRLIIKGRRVNFLLHKYSSIQNKDIDSLINLFIVAEKV